MVITDISVVTNHHLTESCSGDISRKVHIILPPQTMFEEGLVVGKPGMPLKFQVPLLIAVTLHAAYRLPHAIQLN